MKKLPAKPGGNMIMVDEMAADHGMRMHFAVARRAGARDEQQRAGMSAQGRVRR